MGELKNADLPGPGRMGIFNERRTEEEESGVRAWSPLRRKVHFCAGATGIDLEYSYTKETQPAKARQLLKMSLLGKIKRK